MFWTIKTAVIHHLCTFFCCCCCLYISSVQQKVHFFLCFPDHYQLLALPVCALKYNVSWVTALSACFDIFCKRSVCLICEWWLRFLTVLDTPFYMRFPFQFFSVFKKTVWIYIDLHWKMFADFLTLCTHTLSFLWYFSPLFSWIYCGGGDGPSIVSIIASSIVTTETALVKWAKVAAVESDFHRWLWMLIGLITRLAVIRGVIKQQLPDCSYKAQLGISYQTNDKSCFKSCCHFFYCKVLKHWINKHS